METKPLVSIGVPTFNRLDGLRRAVASVLSQTYRPIELIISDNGSTDGTSRYCRGLIAEGITVRVLRHESNRGAAMNFSAALAAASGDFFMWLADDDWLNDDYLSCCIESMLGSQPPALVVGRELLHRPNCPPEPKPLINLTSPNASERVRSFYDGVARNTMFYGLARTDLWRGAADPLRDQLGMDWLVCSRVVLKGRVITDARTVLHRTAGGESADLRLLAAKLEENWLGRRLPYWLIGVRVAVEVVHGRCFRSLSRPRRLALAARCFARVLWRKDLSRRIVEIPTALLSRTLPPSAYRMARAAFRAQRWRRSRARRG